MEFLASFSCRLSTVRLRSTLRSSSVSCFADAERLKIFVRAVVVDKEEEHRFSDPGSIPIESWVV